MASQYIPLSTFNPTITPPRASYHSSPYTMRRALDTRDHLKSFYDTKTRSSYRSNMYLSFTNFNPSETDYQMFHREEFSRHRSKSTQCDEHTPRITIECCFTNDSSHWYRSIDQNTRMLCYTTLTRTDYVPDTDLQRRVDSRPFLNDACGTLAITFINYGIDVAVLLKLPNRDRQLVSRIDHLLDRIIRLLESVEEVRCEKDEESLLEHVSSG